MESFYGNITKYGTFKMNNCAVPAVPGIAQGVEFGNQGFARITASKRFSVVLDHVRNLN